MMIERRAPSETVFLDKNDTVKNYFNPSRRLARGISSYSLLGAGVSSIAILRAQGMNAHANFQTKNPIEYGLTYHSGDFLNGFENAWILSGVLGLLGVPFKVRMPLAVASSATALMFAEVPALAQSIHQAFGTPDILDFPAGVLGLGIFVATTLIARKMAKA